MQSLYERTRELLNQCSLSIREVSEQSGLPYEWLVGIKYARIKDPSVNRIQELYEFLTGNNLPV